MKDANADVLCFGHSHKPYHRIINVAGKLRHAVNIGSVGKPKDGDSRSCYLMLTVHSDRSKAERNKVEVTFIRTVYDIEKAAQAVINSPLPNELADMLHQAN